jgi:hypothetical protein
MSGDAVVDDFLERRLPDVQAAIDKIIAEEERRKRHDLIANFFKWVDSMDRPIIIP